MSIIGSNILAGAAGSGVSAYEIEQSLRFNSADSAYLNRTPGSATNRRTWTWSGWVKRSGFSAIQFLFTAEISGTQFTYIAFDNDQLRFFSYFGSTVHDLLTSAKYRDPSAWYHVVVAFDSTQSTSSNRAKLYVNGTQITAFQIATYPSQNVDMAINNNVEHRIGREGPSNGRYLLDGYLAEVNFIDGSALDPEDFGEFDDNAVWRPIKYAGSYTGNSFYLKFDAADVDGDSSGLGNDFTAVNVTTSGTGTDVMSDTPTTNYCTLNPVGSSSASQCSNGNLQYYNGTTSAWRSGVSTFAVSSGKWYFEAKFTSFPASSAAFVGIGPDTIQWVNNLSHFGQGSASGSYGYYSNNGYIYIGASGTSSSYGATYTTNDVIGCALDLDAGTLRFYKNGTDQGQAVSGLTGTWNVGVSSLDTPAVVNFGQRAFEYTPPTGFNALNTANLPAPDIADGSEYFNTVLYTGNGSYPRAVTGAGFSPDWVWLKSRSDGYGHGTYDRVRGVGTSATALRIDSTSAEGDAPIGPYIDLDSLDTDGFTLGNTVSSAELFNLSTKAYAAWCWKADNTSGSSNTSGSITSTVSANPTAGFSIVTFNKNTANTVTSTFGHGLGVAPKMIIVKHRDQTDNWRVYTETTGNNARLQLNTTDAVITPTATWGTTSPTSTVFSLEAVLTGEYVAYCFAEVEGYSKFGSYTGNGSSDGPCVWCGFRPAWVLIKNSNSATDWHLFDTARDPSNEVTQALYPDTSGSEDTLTNNEIDILSNGFKLRSAGGSTNGSGNTLIFAAFSEHPFGGSGVSPATAR